MDSQIANGLQIIQDKFHARHESEFDKFSEIFSFIKLELDKVKSGNENLRVSEEAEKLRNKLAEEKNEVESQRNSLSNLRSQIAALAEEKLKNESQIKLLKDEDQILEDEISELKREKAEINNHFKKLKYKCALYRNAARICWDDSSDLYEIQGFVVGNSSLKPFYFSLKKNSTAFISHSIWKLISESME